MKLIVNAHKIEIEKTPVNEKEIDITVCQFEFAPEITDEYVKEAYFTLKGDTYKKIITNNQCSIPSEVLVEKGTVEVGVVAYLVENSEEIKRYNPTPAYFDTWLGSLREAENSEEITPSEMEQYQQALQDGLSEVNSKIDEMDEAILETSNLNITAEKTNNVTYVTITDKEGNDNTVQILDGEDGQNGQDGEKGDAFTYEDFTPEQLEALRGPQGPAGQDGTNGRDGAIQYTAGDNITIENNVISATGGDLSNYYTKTEIDSLITDDNFIIMGSQDATSLRNAQRLLDTYKSKNISLPYFIKATIDNETSIYVITGFWGSNPYRFTMQSVNTWLFGGSSDTKIKQAQFRLWTDNDGNVTDTSYNQYNSAVIMTSTNLTSVTPTSNYHPATKKYVDDAIAGVGGSSAIYEYVAETTLDATDDSSTVYMQYYLKDGISVFNDFITNAYTKYQNDSSIAIRLILTSISQNQSSGDPYFSNNEQWYYPQTGYSFNAQRTVYRFISKPTTRYYYGQGNNPGIKTIAFLITIQGSWSNDTFTCSQVTRYIAVENTSGLPIDNTTSYTPTSDYHPATKKYVDDKADVKVIQSPATTYSISTLSGNKSYKLGTLTSLEIFDAEVFDKETIIYFTSGSTATNVTVPTTLTNLGDAPTMTTSGSFNSGTCEASKSYIIAVLNRIAVWKAY